MSPNDLVKHITFAYSGINDEMPMQSIRSIGKYLRFTSITRFANEFNLELEDVLKFFDTRIGKICIEHLQVDSVEDYMITIDSPDIEEQYHGCYVHPMVYEAIILWIGRPSDVIASLTYLADW